MDQNISKISPKISIHKAKNKKNFKKSSDKCNRLTLERLKRIERDNRKIKK